MLISIFQHTPIWVFGLFAVLLVLGWLQSRPKSVGRTRASILPVLMLALSFHGVVEAFGVGPESLSAWVLGVVLSAAACLKLGIPRGVRYSEQTGRFHVPGSWMPLGLMMAIFLVKYGVAVMQARHLPQVGTAAFAVGAGLCYGLLSGVFLGRRLVVWRSAHNGRGDQAKGVTWMQDRQG